MYRLRTSLRLAIAAVVLLLAAARPAAAQGGDYSRDASYQEFYDELSPYGEWMNDPEYGYVWVPDAGNDFRPYYSNGYWTNTDYGNTWVSDYPWGWAPFHYGRWTYNSYYGWVWVPGNTWGPAWVSWRSGGGCYGWAPLGPGISINASFGTGYYVPETWWNFTPQQYILSPGFRNHSYGPRYNNTYIHQTTIINNTYVYNHNTYITGPRRGELERSTGRPVQPVAINTIGRPDRSQVRGNALSIYRPHIAESTPRATERPQRFGTAQQPIGRGGAATELPGRDRNGLPGTAPGRTPQQAAPAQGGGPFTRPSRGGFDQQQQQQAAPQRVEQSGRADIPAQQGRQPFERQPQTTNQQPAQNGRGFDAPQRVNQQPAPQRMERPQPQFQQQQQPVQQPRMERPQMQQPMQQQPRMERPQMQQPAQQAPARIERPQPQMQQPQRTEAPRPAPQREMSAPQQRPAASGGGERTPFGRR